MRLANGEPLPAIAGTDLEGGEVMVNDLVAGHWGVVLLYRGHW